MNKENYEGLRKQLDNGSLDIPSQITILEIAYNLEQQLQSYKDKEDKLREYANRNIKENKELMEKYKEKINKLNKYDLTELFELSNQEAFHKAWYMCSDRVLQILNEGDE